LSPGQVSSLFILWSLTSFVLEVPSGAWADTVDRRLLLVASAAVYAAAFAAWLVWPSYPAFAVGFVLWGLSSAMMSGTFEALLYDELAVRSRAGEYARLTGWAHAAAMAANLVATAAAAPLFAWAGYGLVGWTSVGIALLHGLLAWWLPAAPRLSAADGVGDGVLPPAEPLVRRYAGMLRLGVSEAARHRSVRHLVIVSAVLLGLTAYDEYFPLVAREHGAATDAVPLLVAIVVVGQLVGTALAGRTAAMSGHSLGAVVALAGLAISTGVLVGQVAGFVAVGVGYGLLHNAIIVTEARLQESITGAARATVTSVAGVGSEVGALMVYGAVAVGSAWASVSTLVALLGVPTLLTAVAVARWLPSRMGREGAAAAGRGSSRSTGDPGVRGVAGEVGAD
jgi:MFS family permease